MAEPLPKCFNCEGGCLDNPYNADQECWPTTLEAREAIARLAGALSVPVSEVSDWRKEFPWADSIEEVWAEFDS
jgi:hypothetical protein